MNTHRFEKAFTVIEVLLVAVLVVIVGAVTTTSLFRWQQHRQLNSTAEQIATLIREAISRSMNQDQSADWGIYFDNQNINAPFFSLFYSLFFITPHSKK